MQETFPDAAKQTIAPCHIGDGETNTKVLRGFLATIFEKSHAAFLARQ